MRGVRYFFASLLTEDDGDTVPDLARVTWFALSVLLLIGILVFFVMALILAIAIVHGRGGGFSLLREYAEAFAIIFAGAGATMGLCAAALALKTKSGA